MRTPYAQRPSSRWHGLGTAVLMAVALLLLSLVRRGAHMISTDLQGKVFDSLLVAGIWGTTLGRNVFVFAVTIVLLHAVFGAGCWVLARLSEREFPSAGASRIQWVAIWVVGLTLWLFIANAALFPHSLLGAPYATAVHAGGPLFNLFHVATALAIVAIGIVVFRSAMTVRLTRRTLRISVVVCAALGALGIAGAYASHRRPSESSKPHVIIIGLDSLRYDVATARGPQAIAPNVRKFLDEAVSFSDAMTPLARTYPAWVSILTGRDPHTTGAVVNLLPRSLVNTGDTLGDLYRRAGYHTVYAIDEVRFSNIDASYGFDQAITPPIGASDFLLGWFGDTPLSNLIMHSRLGAILFPFFYANRADSFIYNPDQFVARLDRTLRFDEPTFLALHLTLAHWPYSWADSRTILQPVADVKDAYDQAVQRVDRQFHDVLSVLQRRGALKNAIVVVLSDHGEGLGQPDDLLIPKDGLLGEFDADLQSHGHGTSVISPHQYQVLLALRTFGSATLRLPRGAVIDAPVSLEDVAPTLTEISALSTRDAYDGRSLLPLMQALPGAAEGFRSRVRFTETEFNPRGFAVAVAATGSDVAGAVRYYRVDPHTDHVEVRPEYVGDVVKNRQFAAVLGEHLLAAIPRGGEVSLYDMILMGRNGSNARKVIVAPSATEDPQLAQLWQAFQDRLGLSSFKLEQDATP